MSDFDKLSEETQKSITEFVKKFEVKSITTEKNNGILAGHEVTDLVLFCGKEVDGKPAEYKVHFKLAEQYNDINQYLASLTSKPELSLTLGEKLDELSSGRVDLTLRGFLKFIHLRMIKAKQEEEIQCIPFVGNTFVLNGVTVFKVLSDDGEGKLTIDIIDNPKSQELMLSAHGLMDGLYTGFIKEAARV